MLWRSIMNVTPRGAQTPEPPAPVPETDSFEAFEATLTEDGLTWEQLPAAEAWPFFPRTAREGRVYKLAGWEHSQDRYEIVWIEAEE